MKALKFRKPRKMYGDRVLLKLPDPTLNALYKLASLRSSKKYKGTNKQVDQALDNVEAHYCGLKAECAVASYLHIDMDMSLSYAGDSGYDLKMRGVTIDVKMSVRDLKVNKPGPEADILFLVQPLSPFTVPDPFYKDFYARDPKIAKPDLSWKHVVLVGWITKTEFMDKAKLRNFGYGERLFMEAERLHRPSLLFVNLHTQSKRASEEALSSGDSSG